MNIVTSLAHETSVSAACSVLNVPRAVASTGGNNPEKKNRHGVCLRWPFLMKNAMKSSMFSMRTALSIKPLKRFTQHFLMKRNIFVPPAPYTVFWKKKGK
jgi:hypothetical protein